MSTQELRRGAALDAANILVTSWDEDLYPVDPFAIAHALGITVYSGDLAEDVSGMLRVTNGEVKMYIDTDDHPRRQRFTAAHELGHFVSRLNAGDLDDLTATYIDRRNWRAAAGSDPEEIYANEFAACLLMPEPIVHRLQHAGLDVWEMARFFDVSQTSMEIRLDNLRATQRA